MILDISFRTDIIANYSEWLHNRFNAGFLYQRNPYSGKVSMIDLSPEVVDVIAFCSKNYAPFMKYVDEINEKYRCYWHYTITGYGEDIEPNIPSTEESMEILKGLTVKVGKDKVAWRYDPILITEKYNVDWHINKFAEMTSELSPYVDRCIFSFVSLYQKVRDNMPDLKECTLADREQIMRAFGKIAIDNGLYLQTCGHGKQYTEIPGIHMSGCQTPELYENAFGIKFNSSIKSGNFRTGCLCMQSNSIGDYNTCVCGCKYCYATKNYGAALANYRKHDPKSPLLISDVLPGDEILVMKQKTFVDDSVKSNVLF